jgi:two-component system sensor histidine kinase BaeS
MSEGLDRARLAVLVHEVRSPVAALSAVAEAVGESTPDESARPELVRLALAACRAIERIVFDVAVASVRFETVDLAAVTRDALAPLAMRGVEVEAHVDDAGRLLVSGDPIRLRQALDNLLANAVAHGGSGRSVIVRATRSGESVQLAVTDHGRGIPRHELTRIFELGVRLDDSTPGSGLGLALTRAIVDAHEGVLEVHSRPGEGATFTITLPALGSQPAT